MAVSGSDLYVASITNDRVNRYALQTGAFLGTFVTAGSAGLISPVDILFRRSLRMAGRALRM